MGYDLRWGACPGVEQMGSALMIGDCDQPGASLLDPQEDR